MKPWISLFLFAAGFLFAECGTIECYSPCAHTTVALSGDKCALTWNASLGCFEAYAECGNSQKCLGALCFDACEDKDRYFPKANTCAPYFHPGKFCWGAYGVCE